MNKQDFAIRVSMFTIRLCANDSFRQYGTGIVQVTVATTRIYSILHAYCNGFCFNLDKHSQAGRSNPWCS